MVVLYFLPDWRKVTWAPRGATWCHVVPRGRKCRFGLAFRIGVSMVTDFVSYHLGSSHCSTLLLPKHELPNISYSKQPDNIPKFSPILLIAV